MRRVRRSLAVLFGLCVVASVGLVAFLASSANAGPCDVATKTWDRGAGTDSWSDATNWSPNGVPTAGQAVCIPAGAPGTLVVVSGSVTVGSVEAQKDVRVTGTLALTDTGQSSEFDALLDLQGDLTGDADRDLTNLSWRSGTLSGAGTTTVGGVTVIEDISATRFLSSTLTTTGTVNQTGINTFLYMSEGTWQNTGTWTISHAAPSAHNTLINYSGTNLLHNTGTITRTGGTGTSLVNIAVDNDGTITTNQGTLDIGGSSVLSAPAESTGEFAATVTGTTEIGGTRLGTGATISGADSGVVTSTGTNTVVGTIDGTPGSTLRLEGQLEVEAGASLTTAGNLTWRSGTLSGAGTTTVGGVTVIEDISATRFLSSTLTTTGTVNQTGINTFLYMSEGTWQNTGTWTISHAAPSAHNTLINYSGTNLLHNTGTITRTGGTGTSLVNIAVDNDGTITTNQGTLDIGGSSVLSAPAESTGEFAATVTGTTEIGGTRLGTGATISGADSGVVTSTGTNTVVGTIDGTPGSTLRLEGQLEVEAGASLTTAGNLTWRSGTLSGAGTTTVGGVTVIEDISATRFLSSTLTTTGTVNQTGINTFLYMSEGTWQNTGTWTISHAAPSAHNTLINYSGTNLLHNTGTITRTGGTGTSLVNIAVDNDGTITTNQGTLDIGGQIVGFDTSSKTLSGGTWSATGGGLMDLGGVDVVHHADARFLVDGAGSQIRNSANQSILRDLVSITTNGAVTLRNGQNVTLLAPLTNAGELTLGESSSLTVPGLYKQTNGATRLEAATATLTATGSRVEVQGGTLSGIGTVAPQLRSTGGTIAPGNSPGILTVNGTVDLGATSSLAVEINGATAGTQHDRLHAAGAVTVNGTLAITNGAGHNPSVGQTFDIVTGASRTGSFSGVTAASAGTGKGFDVSYPAGKVTLGVVSVPGQDLVISTAPLGTAFNIGYTGTWRATVSNVGGAATSGTITATLTPGTGQTFDSASGTGWSCSGTSTVTCTRSGALASGASAPPIDLSVDVDSAALPATTLAASVSGGGDTRPSNNSFSASATVVNLVPPVAQLQLSTLKGVAPLNVSASSSLSTGTITTYNFDWGDGSSVSTSGTSASHTFTEPGTYTVTLRAANEVQSSTKNLKVTVLENIPLQANAGDDRTAAPGLTLQFDGGGSVPTNAIDTYAWDFGDGEGSTPSPNATAFHAYDAPGTYTATLTVTRGAESSTDTLEVTIENAVGTGLSIDVTGSGNPLPGADVTVIDGKGVRYSAVAGLGGNALLRGLPNGSYTAYAWADGYLPKAAVVTVLAGNGTADIDLVSGAIATQTLESRRLTYDEIIGVGIDPGDPANQNVYEFELCLAFGNYSCIPVEGIVNEGGFVGGTMGGGGGGGTSVGCSTNCSWSSPEGRITATASTVGGQPTLTFLLIPGEARWLKEFFEVKMTVVNLAPPGFTFEDGLATLDLPEGLTLAPTSDPQALGIDLDDIPGGESGTATWVIRGDDEGEYDLTASYTGSLDPIGKSIKLDATTAEPLKVWGASAVEMTVIADDAAVAHEPYRFTLRIENVTDGSSDPAPVYNPVLAIDEDAGGSNYIVQPGERFEQGTDELSPGEIFEADFVVVPTFSGTLNVAGSALFWVGGEDGPATTITSQPRLAALGVTPTALPGQVQLDWGATPGAVDYRVYRTATPLTKFPVPAPPLATTTATTATVAAPQGPQWYVVSTVYANGVQEMRHEMIVAAPAPPPAGPSISLASASVLEANAGKPRNAQVAVVLSEPSTQPVTVKYAIEADGTASAGTAGTDFKTKTGTLTFKPNSTGLTPTTRYVTAQALPDTLVEADETFQVRLFDPSPGYSLANTLGAVTIVDDDPSSGLQVSIGDATMIEGDTSIKATATNNGKVWITFNQPVATTTTVRVTITAGSATAGSDFKVVKTKVLTFKPGQFQKAVSVPVYPDTSAEPDETVTVTLSEPSAGLVIAKAVGTLTISNDD